ncbi:hypothetical protein GCM10010447_04040 [Streptomyces fulvorobeus]
MSNATIFLRMDFPRKRMASPSSAPPRGGGVRRWLAVLLTEPVGVPSGSVEFRQQTARAYY